MPSGFQCPISTPPWKIKARNKANIQTSCAILKLSRVQLSLCSRTGLQRKNEQARGMSTGSWVRERMLLCFPGVITRSFFKITNQLQKLSWDSDGSIPFLEQQASMVKHHPPCPSKSGTGGWTVLLGRFSALQGLSFLRNGSLEHADEFANAIAFWISNQAYAPQFIKLNV